MRKIYLFVLTAALAGACAVDDRSGDLSASYSGRCVDKNTGATITTENFGATILFGDLNANPESPRKFSIKPDGTFSNSKMFPGRYKVWANGPFCELDTLTIDLKGNKTFDLKAVPNITLSILSSKIEGSKLTMNAKYTVNDNVSTSGDVAIVYGTVHNPGQNKASRSISDKAAIAYKKTDSFSGSTGVISMTIVLGDKPTYYARIGAKTANSDYWNYTEEIVINDKSIF